MTTMNSQGRLDALAIDDPLEYVRLALGEEMQTWANSMDDDSVWYLVDYKIDVVLECSPWKFHGEMIF